MTLEQAFQIIIGDMTEKQATRYLRFLADKLKNQYQTYIMDQIKVLDNGLNWQLSVPNAKENEAYNQTVIMPEVKPCELGEVTVELTDVTGLTLEQHGLQLTVAQDGKSFAITGTPCLDAFRKDGARAESTFELTLHYRFLVDGEEMAKDRPTLEKKIPFVINQDPRKLWRNLPVDWDNMPEPKYRNEDSETQYIKVVALPDGTPQKDIVAASQRGRSHAQEGKPRDDNFRVEHLDNGWYVMAVADGAGSARYSRRGSQIACQESVDYCRAQLAQSKDFEEAIAGYAATEAATKKESDSPEAAQQEKTARKAVGNIIYDIVGKAAFKAHQAINGEAALQQLPAKTYATTLLLTICKHFHFGWFVASFWVGDGAICLYDRPRHTAKILGIPDEGEYGGQTRFLTMPEIFHDSTALYQRLRFCIVDDFTALLLMSDGVSDPKFETDANLNNPDRWDALWDDLKQGGVELTDDNEATRDQLLRWLDFWAPGNHDDRTIAILYEGEAAEPTRQEENEEAKEEEAPTQIATEAQQYGVTVMGYDSNDASTPAIQYDCLAEMADENDTVKKEEQPKQDK